MEDTHIRISRGDPTPTHPPPPILENHLLPSITSRRGRKRRKGVMLLSVTLLVGAAALVSVATIGFLSLLYTTSRADSQSKPGQAMTSKADDRSEPLHIEKREQGVCQEEFCLTKECVHAASSLLNFMDDSVDPCEDFYRYACGGWMKRNEHQVAGDNFVYSVVFNVLSDSIDTALKELLRTGGDVPRELLQTKPYEDLFFFYERCREVEQGTQDMTAVHEVLRELDQFQVGKPFESSSWDLTRALLQLFQVNGAPLFDIMIDSDVRKVGKFAILITSPRHFGLISRLKRNPLNRRGQRSLQEFLTAKGRRVLFGDTMDDEVMREAMRGGRPATWAAAKEGQSRLASQKITSGMVNPVGNLVPADDELKEEREATTMPPYEASTSSSSSSSSTTSSSLHTPPTPPHALPSTSQLPTTHPPHIASRPFSTTTSTTATTRGPHDTNPRTDFPPSTSNSTNTTTSEEQTGEGAAGDAYGLAEQQAVSRRIVYRVFQDDMDAKRLESLATTLQDTFPNAAVASSASSSSPSSSSSSSSTEGDAPDDVYSEVMTRFLPILHELLPSKREELETQQSGKQYNHFTISALQQRCPVIDWSVLLGGLFNMTVTDEHNIYVHYPEHLTKLCSLLDNTEPWVIHYALLTLYSYDVLQETVFAAEGMDREDFCLQAVKGVFGEVMSNLYLHHIGNDTLQEIKASASSIMELLREEVKETLSAASWLREEDKSKAMEKIETIDIKIGAKDSHWDINFVNKSHEQLNFHPDATFLHAVMELYRTFRKQLYNLHHQPLKGDDFIWTFTVQPYVVDAFYTADINTIVFPEAFFHPPYHRHHTPHYLNFGSTATSMAHEIFHALDFLGVQFDHRGQLTRPFSEEMVSRLNNTANCYHSLLTDAFYEEVYIPHTLIAFEIDNTITKNENLADISGLRASFHSYRRWEEREGVEPRLPALPLTPHQLFFLSAAQPYCSVTTHVGNILLMELDEHLPNKMRINGMMKNLPEFARTFNCSSTSKMFTANTCHLF